MFALDDYQEEFLSNIGKALSKKTSIIAQLCTGGGKTVVFAAIAKRFLEKSKKDVIIFVDSEDILNQTRKTLLDWYGINSDTISRKSNGVKSRSLFGDEPRVIVAMVETFDRRSGRESFLSNVKEVGLVIVDECHMGNFFKVFDHFLFSLRIGFTATPVNADKKKPLKNYYQGIVCGPPTSVLIDLNAINPHRGVVRDISYCLTGNINRGEIEAEQIKLGYKGLDFDDKITGDKLSGKRQIQNVIDAYIKHTPGQKALCFNANVAHSKLVTEAMVKAGLNARHMDATCSDEYKADCKRWLKETYNAILCNVGMTTKGFDEKSLQVVILNRLTKSLPLYNQMCGRGARPFIFPDGTIKTNFVVLDMCDNILGGGHGQWSDPISWEDLFNNPKLPKGGVAPCKICPECDYVCHASARICPGKIEDPFEPESGEWIDCGYVFSTNEVKEDLVERSMVLVTKNVDVKAIINNPKFMTRGSYFTFFQTIRACAEQFFISYGTKELDEYEFKVLWDATYVKIQEWQRVKGAEVNDNKSKIKSTPYFKIEGSKSLIENLKEFGFTMNFSEQIILQNFNKN